MYRFLRWLFIRPRIERLNLHSGDMLAITFPVGTSPEEIEASIASLTEVAPGVKAIVLTADVKLSVVRPAMPAAFAEQPLSMADGMHAGSDADTFRTRRQER